MERYNTLEELERGIDNIYDSSKSVQELNQLIDNIFLNIKFLKEEEKITYGMFCSSRKIKKIREEAIAFRYTDIRSYGINSIKLNSSSEKYDAELFFYGKRVFAECGFAKDGHLENYQFRHLDLFGSAPASGVDVKGLKQSVNANEKHYSECVDSQELIEMNLSLINNVIQNKCNKGYDPGYWLFVLCEVNDFENFPFQRLDIENSRICFEKLFLVDCISRTSKDIFNI